MKLIFNVFYLLLYFTVQLPAVTHTITNSGFTFTPDAITISLGDTINFSIESSHNAREVSVSTWNSNETTSNGGFEVPFGGGILILTEAQTYYYVCVPHASLGMKGSITVSPATGVGSSAEIAPYEFILYPNYPNPFNPSTSISFTLPTAGFVTLRIFNSLGQEVAVLLNEHLQTGRHNVLWHAENLSSGIYTCLLSRGNDLQTRKMLLVR